MILSFVPSVTFEAFVIVFLLLTSFVASDHRFIFKLLTTALAFYELRNILARMIIKPMPSIKSEVTSSTLKMFFFLLTISFVVPHNLFIFKLLVTPLALNRV